MHPSEVANRVEPGLGEAECLALDLAGRQEEEECENPQEVRLPPHGGGLVWKAFHKSMLLVKNMVKSMVFYLSLFVQNAGTDYVGALSRPCEIVHCWHHYIYSMPRTCCAKLLTLFEILADQPSVFLPRSP